MANSVNNTKIDVIIFRLYKKGFSIRDIHQSVKSEKITFKTIARSIANSELTIMFEQEEKDGFFIIPSIINYEFRL